METKELFRMKSNYREDMLVQGYRFGKGEKAACIAGAVRGNEIQQLYICSQLVKQLKELENKLHQRQQRNHGNSRHQPFFRQHRQTFLGSRRH